MAKRIQISDDAGVTKHTFPGSKGEMTREGAAIKDTIFGQAFASDLTGLISWGVTTNGVFKGYAGYLAKLMKSGSTTAMTQEAMTLVSGKTYRITNAAKSVWDRTVMPTFEDNNVAVNASNIESIDYLFGRVTFTAGYTVTGPIEVATGSYLPMTQIASGQSFTLTQTANAIDESVFELVQANGGFRTYETGLRTVSLALKGVYASSNAFEALLTARAEVVIEIDPAGDGKSKARAWFKPMTTGQSGDVGELEEQTLNFSLSVPDQADITNAISWLHDGTSTLSEAIRIALDSWLTGAHVDVYYLHDGTNGFTGDAIVTDVTLSGGLDAMNDFSVKLQGCDAPAAFP